MERLVGVVRPYLAAVSLGSLTLAQSTWVVPTGVALDSYIQAAAPGDTLVLGANHPNFTLNKGLNLIGSGTVIEPAPSNGITVVDVPAGQRASLHGLQIAVWGDPWTMQLWTGGLDLRGDITVQGCSASSLVRPPVQVLAGVVQIQNCSLWGGRGAAGLSVAGGICSVVGSTVRGSDGVQEYQGPTYDGGPGIVVQGGYLWLSSAQVRGGNLGSIYGQPSLLGMPGLIVNGSNATAVVTQSTLIGGDGGWYMGFPIYALPAIQVNNGVVYETGNTLQFGAGPTQGGPAAGNVVAQPHLVGVRSTGAMALGATFTVQATAGSSQMPLVLVASLQSTAGMHPLAAQPVLGNGNGLIVQTVAAAPAPGSLVNSATAIPNNVALRGVCVSWQAFQWTGGLVQASAILGGVVN